MMVTKMPEVTESTPAPQSQAGKCQKDESSVNREIATLLLNLASRTQSGQPATGPQLHRETETEAMDLSKYSRSHGPSSSSSSSTISSSPAVVNYSRSQVGPPCSPGQAGQAPPATGLNPYSLLSPGLNNLGSSYLLQNLLIGQIQNLASSPPPHSATEKLMQTSQKSPTNLKPADTTAAALAETNPNNNLLSKGLSAGGAGSPVPSHISPLPLTNLGTSIPLLSGHIVAQLNSLLFSVHGLSDKSLELNIQGQLAAIYSRLQEIVAMINVAKKKETKTKVACSSPADSVARPVSDEQKINKKLEEYQRALYQSSQTASDLSGPSLVNILGSQTSSQPLKLEVSRKSIEEAAGPGPVSHLNRRRSSKDKEILPVEGSPPEKKVRSHQDPAPASSPQPQQPPPSSTKTKSSGKGGKGIRNRVFCGDCPGCLKNDDCGQCRYCRDKTKFGGQNRLRQKCLHRRCQMDTHRRSGGSQSGGRVTSPPCEGLVSVSTRSAAEIYSGVELARYTGGGGGGNDADVSQHSIFSSLLGNPPPPHEESSQTRSDKWKLKHEAMLKLAVAPVAPGDDRKERLKENTENQAVNEEEYSDGKQERNFARSKSLERNQKVKPSDAKIDVGRLTTRSMKPVLAL